VAGRKFSEFGKSQAIHQTKIIQTLHYIIIIINSQCCSPNLPLPNLLRTEFAKLSCYTVHLATDQCNKVWPYSRTARHKVYVIFVGIFKRFQYRAREHYELQHSHANKPVKLQKSIHIITCIYFKFVHTNYYSDQCCVECKILLLQGRSEHFNFDKVC